MKLLKHIFLSSLLLIASPFVFSHGTESAPANPNEGQAIKAGPYILELVVDGPILNLYISDDHNKPLDASGAVASAVVLANKQKTKVALTYQEGNLLVGQGNYSADKKMKVIVYVQLPDAKKVSGRFNPLQ